jgi:hypothetical protein
MPPPVKAPVITVFGWSIEQWAAVRADYGYTIDKPVPGANVAGMRMLREWWYGECARLSEPLEELGFVPRTKGQYDFEWATVAFMATASEST